MKGKIFLNFGYFEAVFLKALLQVAILEIALPEPTAYYIYDLTITLFS
jgi:hypothetical protein